MAIIRDAQGPGVIVAWWLGSFILLTLSIPLTWTLLGRMPIWLAWQVNPMILFLDLFALVVLVWELRVEAEVPGPDLARTFEIEVAKAR